MRGFCSKLCITLMIFILFFSSIGMFLNKAKASTYLIDKADLYSKGEIDGFSYKNINIGVQFVVYKKDGVEYPAYCLDRTLEGVTQDEQYSVTVEKVVENAAVWRAIIHGYPFKSAKQLGCNSNMEAFAATKMAVYDALYKYNWSDFSASNLQGERIIKAAENISKDARSSTETKPIAKVDVKEVDKEWKVDKLQSTYVSKVYEVQTNVKSSKYQVKINGRKIDNMMIVDENNMEKKEFESKEKFKILMPIQDLKVEGEFEIQVTADVETMPILYGKTESSSIQDYALAAGYIEYESGRLLEKYEKNKTKIEIVKKDKETGSLMQGAKFNILNGQKEVIYTDVTTNEKGVAQIEDLIPGVYYIEEMKAPDGYIRYDELIKIDVALNQVYTVYVDNNKIPEEPEKEVETKSIKVEKKLPRTGF